MGKSPSARLGNASWARAIGESLTPIFLINHQRRLILFNSGCTAWTDWPADDVVSRVCDYVTESDPHSLAAVLAACAPPPEVWQGQLAEADRWLPHRTAPPRQVCIRFVPIQERDRGVTMVMGLILELPALPSSVPVSRAHELHSELVALRQVVRSRFADEAVIARGEGMCRVIAQLEWAVQGAGTILLVGERGSGREFLTRVIHARSGSTQAFVPLDCRHTPSSDLKRIIKRLQGDSGKRDAALAGTVFFRDIHLAPRDVQERLAAWLTERPRGELPRIAASADQPLLPLVEQDAFHRDLYFLLSAMIIEVPPLRQRQEELLPLAQYFLEEQNRGSDRQRSGFTDEAQEMLRRYNWPGNVGELREVIESATAHASNVLITPDDFPLSFRAGRDAQRLGPRPIKFAPLDLTLEQVEREQIELALSTSRRNLSQAAELLGLTRAKLYRRIAALKIVIDEPLPPGVELDPGPN